MSTLRRITLGLAGLAGLALLAGCASTQRESPPTIRGSVVQTPSPTGSTVGPQAPGTAVVTVTGPIKATVLSLTGPYDPAGPVLGRSVNEVLMGLRKASAGRPVTCAAMPCWSGVTEPAGSLLLAVRPGMVSCYSPRTVAVTATGSDAFRVDIQSMGVCRPGAGSAARMPAMLIALPGSALPSSGNVTVTVRLSTNTGVAFSPLGTAGFPLG